MSQPPKSQGSVYVTSPNKRLLKKPALPKTQSPALSTITTICNLSPTETTKSPFQSSQNIHLLQSEPSIELSKSVVSDTTANQSHPQSPGFVEDPIMISEIPFLWKVIQEFRDSANKGKDQKYDRVVQPIQAWAHDPTILPLSEAPKLHLVLTEFLNRFHPDVSDSWLSYVQARKQGPKQGLRGRPEMVLCGRSEMARSAQVSRAADNNKYDRDQQSKKRVKRQIQFTKIKDTVVDMGTIRWQSCLILSSNYFSIYLNRLTLPQTRTRTRTQIQTQTQTQHRQLI